MTGARGPNLPNLPNLRLPDDFAESQHPQAQMELVRLVKCLLEEFKDLQIVATTTIDAACTVPVPRCRRSTQMVHGRWSSPASPPSGQRASGAALVADVIGLVHLRRPS
ncbi:hypothetical protein [Sorangium sp. So ce363]|uniref:hypothetical protein n=1 Tax=Sorangium sp. So ce363 TaxID=3133304 RepID=UPI003F63A4C6